MSIEKIYCINLKDNFKRWERFAGVNKKCNDLYTANIERIDAVDARQNPRNCLEQYGLTFSPFTISIGLYFYYSSAAVGCFLSHYKIWQKIVAEKISHALILEDDIAIKSLFEFLEKRDTQYKEFDVLQLTQRVNKQDSYIFFHGSESYILSLNGARKLIETVKTPTLLQNINDYEESLSIKNYYAARQLSIPKMDLKNLPKNCIVAPSDQIFNLCCHSKCNEKVKLNFEINPCIALEHNHSKFSSISPGVQAWKAGENYVEEYINFVQKNQSFIPII